MAHANARLTVHGRALLVQRILAGHRPADVAHQLGCSRATAYKWLARYRTQGAMGLQDRPSRPLRCPHRTPAGTERRILEARRAQRRGADWLGAELGLAASTVGRVIRRHGLPLLCDLDALTGQPVRRGSVSRVRYERGRPGELVHIDVKRLGRIPDGGGWRAHGRGPKPSIRRAQGYDYVHSVVDDHSRLAYSEVHPDERGATCAGFLARAAAFFASHGVDRIEAVMSDNAFGYRLSNDFQAQLARLVPATSSSGPTARGRTGKSSASTARCSTSGPTRGSSSPTPSGPGACQTGWSTTTAGAATAPSRAARRSAACQQRGDRLHLAP